MKIKFTTVEETAAILQKLYIEESDVVLGEFVADIELTGASMEDVIDVYNVLKKNIDGEISVYANEESDTICSECGAWLSTHTDDGTTLFSSSHVNGFSECRECLEEYCLNHSCYKCKKASPSVRKCNFKSSKQNIINIYKEELEDFCKRQTNCGTCPIGKYKALVDLDKNECLKDFIKNFQDLIK